eukprot:2352247-Pleurochrysis_carterae.AAC.1
METLAAAADIREALGHLAALLGVLHVLAGGGAKCHSPDFHLVELARRACPAEGGLPLEVLGKKLIEDVLLRLLRLAAAAQRTTPGAATLDIGATVGE